jgi:hypothetical protein
VEIVTMITTDPRPHPSRTADFSEVANRLEALEMHLRVDQSIGPGLGTRADNLLAIARSETAHPEPAPELDDVARRPVLPRLPDQDELEASIREDRPYCRLERIGPSWRATVGDAVLIFRDVRVDRELHADVTITYQGRHLLRTYASLSLASRNALAKQAALFAQSDTGTPWPRIIFTAVEAVMRAEESLGELVDLRHAPDASVIPNDVLRPIQPAAPCVLVMPGEGGKSTMYRALAVSVASGREVIPGIVPVITGPVLYVAAEDPVVRYHARSTEAICRGIGIDRSAIEHPISLFDARGRPLHRIARSIAERAADHALVILDSQQALLATVEQGGGVRDRDGLFWNAVDAIERPVAILAHPNRSDSRRWDEADGRIAGSEVNRDRARMAWRGTWQDEKAIVGTSFRRYTLTCTKYNHGPRPDPISFAASWKFGFDGDPGTVRFLASDPVALVAKLSPELADALTEYRAGRTTPVPLATALGVPINTAKSRLRLLKDRGLLDGSDDVS